MTHQWLHDGRLIDSENFSIDAREHRPFEYGDKLAMSWGWRECAEAPLLSIVISDRRGVVARALKMPTRFAAYLYASKVVGIALGKHAPRSLTMTVNFAPHSGDAPLIARTGASVLFAPFGIREMGPHTDADFLKSWFGPTPDGAGGERVERRILVRPHYDRVNKTRSTLAQ